MSEPIPDLLEEQRENWGSRAGFVLAAIGSAVGLGNLWGFPYKLYAYGGGAFLIPYILAMLIIGIPVLILEFSLGHMTQRAAPDAFRKTGRKKEPVGWWGIILGFVIITYYPVILAWCLSFLYFCLEGIFLHGGELVWAKTQDGAQKFFLNEFVNVWGEGQDRPWLLGGIQPHIALALGLVWLMMYVCIFRGVRFVSKVVFWTVPLPWLMLLILTIRGLTLPGADRGLAYYLNWDLPQLAQPTTWRFAFGQVFFSMSLAFGVMVTYASFLHRKSDINNNAAIIGLGDLGTSFIAGIAIFSTLGAMSLAANVPVGSVIPSEGTVGMSFIAFPYALAQLPYSAWFGLVFFFALITLGIDSAFSITESILASIVDKTGWNRTATLWGMTFIGFFIGLFYCSRGGIGWLDNIDGFINGPWGIALLGLLECVVLGWAYRISRLREHANERSDWRLGAWWDWNIRIVVPVVLSALFFWSMYDTVTAPGFLISADGQLNWLSVVPLAIGAVAPILAVLLSFGRSRGETPARPPLPMTRYRKSPGVAWVGGTMAIAAALLILALTVLLIRGRIAVLHSGSKMGSYGEILSGLGTPVLLLLGGLAVAAGLGVVATVLASIHFTSAERENARPMRLGRLAGALGTLSVGGGVGLTLALWTMGQVKRTVKHTDVMELLSYITLGLMALLVIGGLAVCFLLAIKATGEPDGEPQLPEGDEA